MVRRTAAFATLAVLALVLLVPVAAAVGHCEEDCAPAADDCCETSCGPCECCVPAAPALDAGAAPGQPRPDGAGLAPHALPAPAVPPPQGVLHVPRVPSPPIR